jgi:GH18 family chitinase
LYQGARGWEEGFSYNNLVEKFINKAGFNRFWDESARAPYLWNDSDRKLIAYDDPKSLKEKCNYIKNRELRGVMFWVYHADNNNELLNTLYENLEVEEKSNSTQIEKCALRIRLSRDHTDFSYAMFRHLLIRQISIIG